MTDCNTIYVRNFGDILRLHPTGRVGNHSGATGVAASRAAIDNDWDRLDPLKAIFSNADEDAKNLPPYLLAAIASRESGAGRDLDDRGYGKNGQAYGIMQINLKHPGLDKSKITSHHPLSEEHIEMAQDILIDLYNQLSRGVASSWEPHRKLQAAVAAYDCGVDNVPSWEDVDARTTNGDYSNDVIFRAQYLMTKAFWIYSTQDKLQEVKTKILQANPQLVDL